MSTYSAGVLALSPTRYYRLADATLTTMVDSSASPVNGSYNSLGVTYQVASLLASDADFAIQFDGSNGYGTATTVNAGDVVSLEAWIKPGSVTGAQAIVSLGNGQALLRLNGNKVEFLKSFVSVLADSGTNTVSIGSVYHVVCTKNGATIKIYLNGVDVTANVVNATLSGTVVMHVGADDGGGGAGSMFNGVIDEAAVYPTALTAAQVLTNYTNGSTSAAVASSLRTIVPPFLPAPMAQRFRPLVPFLAASLPDFSAPGVTASLTLTANAGSVSVSLPGVTATTTLAAPAGSVSVTLPGAVTAMTFAAPAGSVSVGLPGATAALAFAAPTGTVGVTLPGATARATFAAPIGSIILGSRRLSAVPGLAIPGLAEPGMAQFAAPNVSLAGVAAALTFVANPGTVSVSLPGATATAAIAAPAGTVSVALPGATAQVALAAPAGSVSVTLPGTTGTVVFSAPTGSVTIAGNTSLAGVTATLAFVANPGSVAIALPGATATTMFTAPSGGVDVSLPGAAAGLTFAAVPGRVSVTLPGVTASAVFTAQPGLVSVSLPGVTAPVAYTAVPGSVSALPGGTQVVVLTSFPASGSVFTPTVVQLPGTAATFYLLSYLPDEIPMGELATFRVQLAGSDGSRPSPDLTPTIRVLDSTGAVALANTPMTLASGVWSASWTPTVKGVYSVEIRTAYSAASVSAAIPVTVRPRFDPIALAVNDVLVSRM